MGLGLAVEARDKGIGVGVGPHPGRIEVEFLAPDQPRFLTEIDDLLEEALEDVDAEALPDARQTRVVGKLLV
jgi:hypothetical protein